MVLNVEFKLGNEDQLIKSFQAFLKDMSKDVKKDITKNISKIMLKVGSRQEKKIFRYIANRVMGHVEPPKTIDDYPVFQGVTWKPLSPTTIRRKGHKRKWIDSGSLQNYLRALSATYWYGNPKVKISRDLSTVTYYSIFYNTRKPFRAHDKRGVSQELKITSESGSFLGGDMDNANRPIFNPMEEFLFSYSRDLMTEAINDYMEENYGVRYNVPTD